MPLGWQLVWTDMIWQIIAAERSVELAGAEAYKLGARASHTKVGEYDFGKGSRTAQANTLF